MKHYNGTNNERLNYEKAPQLIDMEILNSIVRLNVTRVFKTSTPPSGLSGAVRRYVYQYSESTATYWMTLILVDRLNVIEGKINDLINGILPNPWIERGWRAEWKHNRPAFIGKMATTALVLTAGILLLSRKNKSKQLF